MEHESWTEEQKLGDIRWMKKGVTPAILTLLGVLVIIVCIFGGLALWPESSFRYEPTAAQYGLALGVMLGGTIQGMLLVAMATIVGRLNEIAWLSASKIERKHIFGLRESMY